MRVLVATDARHPRIDGVTDMYGIVRPEAFACGLSMVAYHVTGPHDVLPRSGVEALGEDRRRVCLDVPRAAHRAFAPRHSWERSVNQNRFAHRVSRVLIREHRLSRAATA